MPAFRLNSLGLVHKMLADHIKPGDFCIDATAGKGRDALFLCRLTGSTGKVLAMDIQPAAVEATRQLLQTESCVPWAEVVLDSHAHLDAYAQPETVDAIVFNFGWLPGGDHHIFTQAETSLTAIRKGLTMLKPGGLMALCLYSGGLNGFSEREAVLSYVKELDDRQFTVLITDFANRPNTPPLPIFIWKA